MGLAFLLWVAVAAELVILVICTLVAFERPILLLQIANLVALVVPVVYSPAVPTDCDHRGEAGDRQPHPGPGGNRPSRHLQFDEARGKWVFTIFVGGPAPHQEAGQWDSREQAEADLERTGFSRTQDRAQSGAPSPRSRDTPVGVAAVDGPPDDDAGMNGRCGLRGAAARTWEQQRGRESFPRRPPPISSACRLDVLPRPPSPRSPASAANHH